MVTNNPTMAASRRKVLKACGAGFVGTTGAVGTVNAMEPSRFVGIAYSPHVGRQRVVGAVSGKISRTIDQFQGDVNLPEEVLQSAEGSVSFNFDTPTHKASKKDQYGYDSSEIESNYRASFKNSASDTGNPLEVSISSSENGGVSGYLWNRNKHDKSVAFAMKPLNRSSASTVREELVTEFRNQMIKEVSYDG